MAKKTVTVDLEIRPGGVEAPSLSGVTFSVHQEVLDEGGIFNPVDGAGSFAGGLQINVEADSHGWLELGRYFLGLAEYDVGGDARCFGFFADRSIVRHGLREPCHNYWDRASCPSNRRWPRLPIH